MAKSGYCRSCGERVWLGKYGECTRGHPATDITDVYESLALNMPSPIAAPRRATGRKTAIILSIVFAVVMVSCVGAWFAVSNLVDVLDHASWGLTGEPYPPVLTSDPIDVRPSREQQEWVLGAAALMTVYNNGNPWKLSGFTPTERGRELERESLEVWWGVHDRDDLLDALQWIEEGGHRAGFDADVTYLAGLSDEERNRLLQSPDVDPALLIVAEYGDGLGEKSIIGWDLERYVNLCGWGYLAGYLTEDEAIEYALPACRALQMTFDSWEDMGENYLIGRQYWSPRETASSGDGVQAAYDELCTVPTSPWRMVAWDLDLSTY